MAEKKSLLQEFSKGLLRENPTLVGLLGMCPTLAVTSQAVNALGMGLATMFVLVGSNLVISLLRKIIPATVKLPCYIVIIAGFVTIVDLLLHGYVPELHENLGTFLSLITVNCIILGRAEMFASKNPVLPSVLDGLGMGAGFTLSLFVIGSVRELLGSGSWMASTPFALTLPEQFPRLGIFTTTAGGFLTLGVVIALAGLLTKKKPQAVGCGGCPMACHGCGTDCSTTMPKQGEGADA